MRNKNHTFDQCVSCQRQHHTQVPSCMGCGFALPSADLTPLATQELQALSGRCLRVVNDNAHQPRALNVQRAAGLLVLADRELRHRSDSTARDKGNGTIEVSLDAIATGP